MRKFILFLLFGFLSFTGVNQAQIVLKIANVEVPPGTATATVDVTIDGFTNLISSQFSINYDSLVLSLNSVTNLNTTLGLVPTPGANFGFPGTGNIKKGQMTFSWSDGGLAPKTLPNGARLFTIVFNVLGGLGAKSDVAQSNIPLKIEYVNNDFMEVTNFSSQKGSVTVKNPGGGGSNNDPCPDVVCNNQGNLMLAGDTVSTKNGSTIKLAIRGKNFRNIAGGEGTFSFDTTKLKFKSITSEFLTGTLFVTPISMPTPSPNGNIRFNFIYDGANTITVPDNSKIFEIEFEVLGNSGDTTRICIGKNPPPEMLWISDVNGVTTELSFCVKGGTVIIRDVDPAPPVKLKLNTTMGKKDSIVCLDVRVEDFDMIRNMQFSINWDPAVLKYVSTGMYDLKNLSQNWFQDNANSLTFAGWNTGDNSVISLADNHRIFQVCFELIGPCGSSSTVSITGNPRPIEIAGIYDNQNDYIFDSEITNGSISIMCGTTPMSTCTVNSITNANCFGESNGAVSATVVPDPSLTNCMCVWKNSQGTVVKSSANLSDCSLANAAAGAYTLELVCSGTVACSSPATVGQPDRINVPATGVTNESCGNKGTITVSGITGGNPPYNMYNWNPNVGNTANLSNLDAGTYMLTVTDSKGCTGTQSYQVMDGTTELTVTATQIPVKCFGGNDGGINVMPSGGCTPYTITGSVANLIAGTYTITVTDASVPPNTATATVNVTQPTMALTVTRDTVQADAGQSNGSITLNLTGGTPNYNIVWSSNATQIAANTNPAINLAKGFYNATVTDANGCTRVVSNIEVKEKGAGAPILTGVTVSSNFNGFGVDCNGNCTGRISGSVSSGVLPVRVTIKTGSVLVKEVTLNALGTFEFTQLCAGTYIVEAINNVGTVASQSIDVSAPTRLTAGTPFINCTNEDNEDGSINIDVNNTGVAPYTFQWSTGTSTTNSLENLGTGTYGVTVTDNNGCRLMLNNLDVKNCGQPNDDCGVGSKVLTPDGNQINDVFIINCADELNGTLAIYDRWGRLVYNKAPYDNTFIGIDNKNEILNEGAYVWIYEVNYGNGNREVFSGTLTLLK